MATKKDIHELADSKNIPWDDDPSFKSWSKKVTGKSCLDDMSPEQLTKLKKALDSRGKKKSAEADLSISEPLDIAKALGVAGAVGKWGGALGGITASRFAQDALRRDAAPDRIMSLVQEAKKTHPNVRVVIGSPSTAEDILSVTSPLKLKIKELRMGSPEKARNKVVEEFLQRKKGLASIGINTTGPMYVPKTNTIFLANSNSPAALAHELGHASGGLGKKLLQSSPLRLGVTGLGIGAALKALSDVKAADKSTNTEEQAELLRSGRNFATASAAALAGPLLLEEARANVHALKAAPAGSRMALLRKVGPGFSTYAARRLPAAIALPAALELLRRKAAKNKEKNASLKRALSFLKGLPPDEAVATVIGGVGGGPIPGSSLATLAAYRGAKNIFKVGPPGSAQRRIALKIREMKKADADWDELVKGKGVWNMKTKTSSMKSHTDGALAAKKRDKRERFVRGSAFGVGFAAPVSAGWVGKETVSGPFSGKSFDGVADLAKAARPGDLLMVGQSKPVDIGRTIISLGTGLPHGYHAAIVGEVSRKKGTITIYDLTPKGYRRKEIALTDMQHYSLFRPKNPKTAARAKTNMVNLVRVQETLVSELKRNGMNDRAIKKVTDSMYKHKMNPVIGVRELFIPYVKDQTKSNARAVRKAERNIRMLRFNVKGIAKDIAEEWASTGRIDTEMLKPMQNVCTNTAAMIGIPVGSRSRAEWAGPNDFLRSGKIKNVGYRVSPRYRGFVKYFDGLLTASPHLIRAGVGLGLGSVLAGYAAATQWAKKKKNRKVVRKGFRFKRQIFVSGYTRSDGSVVKGHIKTANPDAPRTWAESFNAYLDGTSPLAKKVNMRRREQAARAAAISESLDFFPNRSKPSPTIRGFSPDATSQISSIFDRMRESLGLTEAPVKESPTPKLTRKNVEVVPEFTGRSPKGASVTWRMIRKDTGQQIGVLKTKGNQVSWSSIDPKYRGQGLSRKMYGEVMRNMPEGRLRSDSILSPQSTGVWNSFTKSTSGLRGEKTRLNLLLGDNWRRSSSASTRPDTGYRTKLRSQYSARVPKGAINKAMAAKIAPTLGETAVRVGTPLALSAGLATIAGLGIKDELDARKRREERAKLKQASYQRGLGKANAVISIINS